MNKQVKIPFNMIFKVFLIELLAVTFLATSCGGSRKLADASVYKYSPDDPELHKTILQLDSAFFAAYNTCDVNLDAYSNFYSDSVEFFHDQGGVLNSKAEIIEATRKNICGKVTRELVKGSVEVYSIKGYGAVEIGLHKFHNKGEKEGSPSKVSKFIIMWKRIRDDWKISKVVSLH